MSGITLRRRPSIADFSEHLHRRAAEIIWPLTFTAECHQHLETLIENAVSRLQSHGYGADYERLDELEHIIQQLAEKMRTEAVESHLQEVNDDILKKVLNWLCPVFPLC